MHITQVTRMITILSVAPMIAAMTACGSGSAGGPAPISTIADARTALDCVSWSVDTAETREFFVADSAACTLPSGGRVFVKQFGTAEAMKNYWDLAVQTGWSPDAAATSGLVVAVPENVGDLGAVREAFN